MRILSGRTAFLEDRMVTILRISLALIFVWFGVLKVFGFNPVYDLVASIHPWLAYGIGNICLGVVEVLIGLLLLTNVMRLFTHIVLIIHLAFTLITLITAFDIMFVPYFPILSLSGEFVIKNIALAAAGLVILVHEGRK